MCNDKDHFAELKLLANTPEVGLGDERCLDGIAEGTVRLKMLLPDQSTKKCQCIVCSKSLLQSTECI